MKKLNRLFAILIAVLGVSATAKADTSILKSSDGWQKITSMPNNLGDYYFALVDKNNDLMLTMAPGANQGGEYYTMYYRKSANPLQHRASLWTIEGSNYTFRNVEYTKLAMQTEWGAAWHYRTHDQPNACEWTATTPVYSLQDACWTIRNGKYPDSGYLGPWNDASFTDGAEVAFNKSGNNIGKFHIYAIRKTQCKDVAANATQANPVDMSVLMTNSDAALAVIGLGGWTIANTITRNNNNGYDGKSGFFEFCNWGGSSWEGSMTQTISSLPNGKYKVRATGQASTTDVVLTLTANGVSTNLNCIGDKGGNISADGSVVASGSGVAGWQYMEVECVVVNGELTISAYSKGTAQYRWANIDNFSFYYCGKDLTTYENALSSKIATARAIDNDKLNTYVKGYLANEITAAENALKDASRTVESLEKQTGELDKAITLANEIAISYTNFNALINVCNSTLKNSEEFEVGAENAFSEIIDAAKSDVESATTAEAINEISNNVEEARRTYIQKADPLNGELFDYTFMIVNPGFDNGTNGWNCESNAQNKQINSNKSNGIITDQFFENWNPSNFTGTISQSISGLPSGKYLLKVAAFGTGANVFANNEQVGVTSGEGVWYEVEVAVSEGTLTFGIKNENATNWIGIDNASLYYKGFDVETAKAGITSLISQGEALAAKPMDKNVVLAGLNEAIGAAREILKVDYPTRKELNEMIEKLNQTMDNANASIAEYNTIATYIAKANGINESIATDYQTQHDNGTISESLETVFQKLEVATYNYVMSNFIYDVALSDDWNSTGVNTHAATFYDEHWSGEKRAYKNQHDGWGDPKEGYPANSWTIDFDQEKTLPAGEYVFKVAGRKSVDATLELVVTMGETVLGTVNDFPSTNEGMGINKAGAASFDANDPAGFSKDGKGHGWQWRYVRFVLDEEATVKVAVHAETNKIYNWVSFGDYTLQMTEGTYLEANKGELDAPIARANELLNGPMGSSEKQALQAAINMTYTTGEQLYAKVQALNNAISNAEAWIVAYNNAKAQLVAALERFEADYNNAEKGALDYMCKTRWTNAISMAKEAAVAKDVLDSYAGFETATKNLNDALDAATTSVNEYSALDAAIKTAKPLYEGGNWGDQAFQRPISAKESLNTTNASAVYNAAEKDGKEVTDLTEALNNGLNSIVLNAPTEGVRYNMVIDYAGWEHHGKAVTYLAGGRTDAGLYNIQYYAAPNANYAQAFTFTAVEGQANCYTLSMTDVEGNERYVCTGTIYGGSAGQIRTTTEADKALAVKVIATATDGIHQLWNTEANDYIGGQDEGFFTVNSHTTFRLQEAAKANVTLKLSKVGWATLILPFDAELPEDVMAWSCAEADGETLHLVEAGSLKANTPYLISGNAGDYNFSGYGMADKDSYTEGLFTGTYVDYTTTAYSNTYVLQKNDAGLGFYLVGESAKPKVGAYRCYMTYEGAKAPMFRIGEGSTDIEPSTLNSQPSIEIYDLMGRKVSAMEKGKMYIVNGVKVMVK